MIILIAALSLSLELGRQGNNASVQAPVTTCNIRTVSYKFVGAAGQQFRYGRETYSIPATGSIELIASRSAQYQINGKSLPLDVFPIDDFGSRTVSLPTAE